MSKMSMMVYDMPYGKRLDLERILDINQQWKELAKQIKSLSIDDVEYLGLAAQRPGGSPTSDLLTKWGQSNPTVMDLFYHLKATKNERALAVLKGVVPDRYFREMNMDVAPPVPMRTSAGQLRMKSKTQPAQRPPVASDTVSELDLPSSPGEPPQNMAGVGFPLYGNTPSGTPVPPYQSQTPSLESNNKPYRDSYNSCVTPPSSIQPPRSIAPPSAGHPFQNGANRQPTESHCSGSMATLSSPGQGQRRGQGQGSQSSIDGNALSSVSTIDLALNIIPEFSLSEIQIATSDFDPSHVIGRGGFGIVYRGKLERLKLDVAIKKLNEDELQEIESLFRCRHDNIIPLLGYSRTPGAICLVYTFMKNGSLDDRLSCKDNTAPLTWLQRMNILCGAAKAVHYLHGLNKPILHGDIKSPNILLDKHFEAKMADFGLAKVANSGTHTRVTHVSQYGTVYGSKAYLPDEYLEDTSKLRKQVDVYSFGIVIFETCLGVRASDVSKLSNQQFKLLKNLIEKYRDTNDNTILYTKLRDPLCADWPMQLWSDIMKLGFLSTVRSWRKRPHIKEIVEQLERLFGSAEKVQHEKQNRQAASQLQGGCHGKAGDGQDSVHSHNMSFISEGAGQSLHQANTTPGPVPIQKLANSLGKMTLDTIPSSSIVDKNNIGVDPETGDYMTLPGGEEGDYLHLDKTSMHPGDYVNVPAGAKNINQSAATPINIDQSAATAKNIDRSAGVISSEKLDEFEASLRRDPLNQLGAVDSSMPVKTVARSEQLDVDDPKWFESDEDKLQKMGSAAVVGIPDLPDVEDQLRQTEAYRLQETFDRISAERHASMETNASNVTVDDRPAAETHRYLCDYSGLDGITQDLPSGPLHGGPTKEKTKPNLYITPPGSRRPPAKCPGPPPPPPATEAAVSCADTEWYSSLDGTQELTEEQVSLLREQAPPPRDQVSPPGVRSHAGHHHSNPSLQKPDLQAPNVSVSEGTASGSDTDGYSESSVSSRQHNIYLANESDNNISIRRPSSSPSLSTHSSSERPTVSYHPSDQPSDSAYGLYCPKSAAESAPQEHDPDKNTDEVIDKIKKKNNPMVSKWSKKSSSEPQVDEGGSESQELMRKKKNKKPIGWLSAHQNQEKGSGQRPHEQRTPHGQGPHGQGTLCNPVYPQSSQPHANVERHSAEEQQYYGPQRVMLDGQGPVEHHQSLTASERSDYHPQARYVQEHGPRYVQEHGPRYVQEHGPRYIQGEPFGEQTQYGYGTTYGTTDVPNQEQRVVYREMGSSHNVPGRGALRVITSGTPPTLNQSSPPIYKQSNLR